MRNCEMDKEMIPDIKYLFEPRAVAVIGASTSKEKIGYKIVENIVISGYSGKIYPINPKGGDILNLTTYKSLGEIDGEVDMACISIPAKYTFDAVKDCAAKGVKFLVIITSGFSEVGNLEEEKQIVAYAHEHGMRVLGPNIFGIYSSKSSMNATFGPSDIRKGNVAIITQSGALGIAMIGKTKAENIGLSAIVSVGNKSDLDETEVLEYLVENEETKVILMYVEGVKNGERLVEVLKHATKKKPVIVIKSGRSKRGAMAAASHTGSLAGADEIFSDVMRQCGVQRAESIQDALNWCKFLGSAALPTGDDAVIVTNGGGIGVMAADACEKHSVNLFDDIQTLKAAFSDAVPAFGSVKNPVDITGQATMEDYELALNAAINNDAIHSIICLGCETALINSEKLTNTLEKISAKNQSAKPMVYSFFGGEGIEKSISHLRTKGVPIFSDVYEAVSCMGAIYHNYRNVSQEAVDSSRDLDSVKIDDDAIAEIIRKVRAEDRTFLLSHEALALMTAAGITMPKSYVARNIDEAVKYANEMGYPVVMKVVSRDIIHKSDAGGVALDLENEAEVIDAYQAIIHRCKAYKADAKIDGIEVAEMVHVSTETIVGARHDNAFGPVVMFGLGGIYVEVMKDVSFRAFPLDRKEAVDMISEIKSYALLLGVRGEKKKDINCVVDVILKVGLILRNHKDISDIEVNPLIVYEEGDGVKALDARILLSKTE